MLKTCIGIFLARIFDVSLGTLRTVYSVKGKQIIASIIAFIEVLIWFVVAREALNTTINSIWVPISYAAGYATGTFIGTTISKKFISEKLNIQIITKANNNKLITNLKEKKYQIFLCNLKQSYDDTKKDMIMVEINKRKFRELLNIIKKYDSKAFVIASEIKLSQNGYLK